MAYWILLFCTKSQRTLLRCSSFQGRWWNGQRSSTNLSSRRAETSNSPRQVIEFSCSSSSIIRHHRLFASFYFYTNHLFLTRYLLPHSFFLSAFFQTTHLGSSSLEEMPSTFRSRDGCITLPFYGTTTLIAWSVCSIRQRSQSTGRRGIIQNSCAAWKTSSNQERLSWTPLWKRPWGKWILSLWKCHWKRQSRK